MDLNLLSRSVSNDLFRLDDSKRLGSIEEGHGTEDELGLGALGRKKRPKRRRRDDRDHDNDGDRDHDAAHGDASGVNADKTSSSVLAFDAADDRAMPPSRGFSGSESSEGSGSMGSLGSIDERDVDKQTAAQQRAKQQQRAMQHQGPAALAKRPLASASATMARAGAGARLGQPRRPHYEDTFAALTRNVGKGFALGFFFKLAFNLLKPLLNLLRGRKPKLSKEVLLDGAQEYGLFLGSLLGVYNGLFFELKKHAARFPLLRSSRAALAGTAAGASLLWLPRESRWGIVLFALVRAFEQQAKMLAKHGRLPTLEHGDTALMMAASGSMLHAFMMHPATLDPSYVAFLNVHCQLPPVTVDALARIYRGQRLDVVALNLKRAHMAGRPARLSSPLGYDSWRGAELMNPTMSFPAYTLKYFLRAMKLSVPLYLPVFLTPVLLFYPGALLKRPRETLLRLAQGVLRSSVFLSLYCTMGFGSLGVLRDAGLTYARAGRFGQYIYFVAGLISGTATLIEKRNRRIELALYVFSKALEAQWNRLVASGWAPRVPNGEALVFMACMGTVMQAYTQHPELMRPAYRSVLARFFDSEHVRHEFYSLPRIVSKQLLKVGATGAGTGAGTGDASESEFSSPSPSPSPSESSSPSLLPSSSPSPSPSPSPLPSTPAASLSSPMPST